jgi:hypothetical protein
VGKLEAMVKTCTVINTETSFETLIAQELGPR